METSRGLDSGPSRRLSRTYTTGNFTDVMDPEIIPSSLAVIAPILRVANEVEEKAPRVAYLCRFYAFDKAHKLDPTSAGRGVRQFKTALLHKLEKDDQPTLAQRKAKTDGREMQNYYQDYYDRYVKALESTAGDSMDRAQLARSYQTAAVLFDVLRAVNLTDQQDPIAPEIVEISRDVDAKKEIYVAYNILPLDPASAMQAIMMFPEVKAAVTALRNTRGLPWSSEAGALRDTGDLLDWLQIVFGFQKHNVANQREHLILLLANIHMRQIPKPDPESKLSDVALNNATKRLFKNYRTWCRFLGREENLRLPTIQQEVQQRKILYMGLYLLIWGEAANLRFMPESLCYIFHHMAGEVQGMMSGNVSEVTGENIKPAYGGESDAFLNKVVTPIYNVIAREVEYSKQGAARHSQWRNYDDLNEYFWSVDCFRLGWPMRGSADFFKDPTAKLNFRKDWGLILRNLFKDPFLRPPSWIGKTNFVEVRSFWHIIRSFDRMWSFFVLALQAMIIIAWNGTGSLVDVFAGSIFKKVMSIFITAAILRLMQAVIDIGLSFKAWHSMKYMYILRYILKVVVAVAWVIILPVCYAHTWGKSTGLIVIVKNWFGKSESPSLYITAILVYLAPDALGALMFLFPMIRRGIERSNLSIIRLLLWWGQPPLYVGRGMHESPYILFKYTLFWILLLTSKFLFSFYVEIKPLVKPTKEIMTKFSSIDYQWHEFFPREQHNVRVVLVLWTPIIMVYFMDTQIWYAVWSTIFGGINGAFSRLGEIRTLAMLRSRFRSLPGAFNANLIPSPFDERVRRNYFSLRKSYRPLDELYKPQVEVQDTTEEEKTPLNEKHHKSHFEKTHSRHLRDVHLEISMFTQLWNEIMSTFREEDYINDEELELLLIPYSSDPSLKYVQWPPFLLANKIALALEIAKDFTDETNDDELVRRIESDVFLKCAIEECYDLFTIILRVIAKGEHESRVVEDLIKGVQESLANRTLLKKMKMSALPLLCNKIVELVKTLEESNPEKAEYVTFLLQDIYEVYTTDVVPQLDEMESSYGGSVGRYELGTLQNKRQLFEKDAIQYPLDPKGSLSPKIKRLLLLLTKNESALDIPHNLEARRRIAFFTNSLFMDIPPPPKIRNMMSFSVLTPYYDEEIMYTQKALEDDNEDGVSILFYLQKIYPDEWNNFLKRTGCPDSDFWHVEKFRSEISKWASYRAQTLSRTVRGMMYYHKALKMQAFFDTAENSEIMQSYKEVMESTAGDKSQRSLPARIQAMADMKFTYTVTCQKYGQHKRTQDTRATDILHLMRTYPALRVAYIDEVDESNKKRQFYSVLVKADDKGNDQEIYRIRLPGNPILGEGKPENQNHAIIFTRGEALQAIDMNQDNYLEEAFKMRNFLQEFLEDHGVGQPDILGMREHIFTGSVSSLAGFMSNQESSFVTIGQRVLANPLKVRFHYGHPDVFDRLFHLTRGGLSKASHRINLSEDIFAGFNTTLRRGNVTHHEYIQVGKGRDVGLNQISLFEAKIAYGNGEQAMSRDIYRLGHRLDFFRMLSVYFTTVGSYFSTLIVVLTVYVFLYGRIYLSLSGLEASLVDFAGLQKNKALQAALASQSIVQIGLLMALPMVMEIGLEKGFRKALSEFIIMQLQLAPVFFTFSMGTKVHFFGRTLLHGGAKYKSTGRGFVVFHAKFAENYRLYSRSHFTKGMELLALLIVYYVYGASVKKNVAYILITFSLWFLVGTWLYAPFLFNPSGFEWQKIVDDWDDWNKWVSNRGGVGVPAEKSWESWWEEEQEHLKHSGFWGQLIEIILSSRFLIYQYGLVYHLHISRHNKSIFVYLLSWLVIVFVLAILKGVSLGRRLFSAEYQLLFRLLKGLLFLSVLGIVVVFFVVGHLTVPDVFVCALAFLPSGWFLVQVAQTCKEFIRKVGLLDSVKALARGYEYLFGLVLFVPVATLAWFPFISEFQTRLLFNQGFSRGLQISRILAGRREKKMN